MQDGIATFHVSCLARTPCRGALLLDATAGALAPPVPPRPVMLRHPINRADLLVTAKSTGDVRVPLSPQARRLVEQRGRVRVGMIVQLAPSQPVCVVNREVTIVA